MRGNMKPIRYLLVYLTLALNACASTPGLIFETQSQYGPLYVEENEQGMRTLLFERHGARQSVVKLGDPEHLELSYAQIGRAHV